MERKKTFLIAALVCIASLQSARAQQFDWTVTHWGTVPISGSPDSYQYAFYCVDCYDEVCTAGGQISGTAFTGNHLMFFRSTDGGRTWADQDPDLPSVKGSIQEKITGIQQIDSLNAVGVGYIADTLPGATDDTGFVVRTFDGGLTWQRQSIHTSEIIADVHFSDPMTGIIILNRPIGSGESDACDIETTHDGGVTWALAPFSPWVFGSNCHSDGGENFRVISYQCGPIYTTTDDWQTVDSTLLIIPLTDSSHILTHFNFKGKDTIIGYGVTGYSTPQRLFIDKSIDGGMTWDSVSYNGVAYQPFSMSSLDRDVIFLSVLDNSPQLGESTDHGMTWNVVPMTIDTFVGQSTISIAVTARDEAVAIMNLSSQGVLIRGISGLDAISSYISIIDDDIQIYPNPFSYSTTLWFTSPESGYATVSIVNTLGVEVARVFVGELSAGEHSFEWNAPVGLPQGMYECILRMNGSVQENPLVLSR